MKQDSISPRAQCAWLDYLDALQTYRASGKDLKDLHRVWEPEVAALWDCLQDYLLVVAEGS